MQKAKFGAAERDLILQLFDPGAIDRIEEICRVTPPHPMLRFELASAVWRYAHPDGSALASVSEVGSHFADLLKAMQAAREALRIDGAAGDTMAIVLAAEGFDTARLWRLDDELETLAGISWKRSAAGSRGGRPPDVDRAVFLARLHAIYVAYSGRPAKKPSKVHAKKDSPPNGEAVRYIGRDDLMTVAEFAFRAASRVSSRLVYTNNGLGSAIERMLELGQNSD